MGQDFGPPTPTPEASPAAVPDGCLAPRTSLGLSPELLGPTWAWRVMSLAPCEGCKLAQVGGAGRFSPMCFHCRCWQVWKLHIACKPFDGHVPHSDPTRQSPFPECFQCRMRCWLSGPRALQNETCQEEVFFGFVFVLVFNISHKSNRVGTHADLDPIVGTMPVKAVPRGKVSSSSVLEMKLESPPTT